MTLVAGIERVGDELDEIKQWRMKFYGAKTVTMMLFAMFAHAGVVLAAIVGILTWYSKSPN
jgi:hypothetical protein